ELVDREPRRHVAQRALAAHAVALQHRLLGAGPGLLGAHAHRVPGADRAPEPQLGADLVHVVAADRGLGVARAVAREVARPVAVGANPLPQRAPQLAAADGEGDAVLLGVG